MTTETTIGTGSEEKCRELASELAEYGAQVRRQVALQGGDHETDETVRRMVRAAPFCVVVPRQHAAAARRLLKDRSERRLDEKVRKAGERLAAENAAIAAGDPAAIAARKAAYARMMG